MREQQYLKQTTKLNTKVTDVVQSFLKGYNLPTFPNCLSRFWPALFAWVGSDLPYLLESVPTFLICLSRFRLILDRIGRKIGQFRDPGVDTGVEVLRGVGAAVSGGWWEAAPCETYALLSLLPGKGTLVTSQNLRLTCRVPEMEPDEWDRLDMKILGREREREASGVLWMSFYECLPREKNRETKTESHYEKKEKHGHSALTSILQIS